MKVILFICVIVSGICFSQEIEVPKEKYPFSNIYEWRGKGAILINKDPNEISKEVNLTLVDETGDTKWNESFSPKSDNYYLVMSEESKYIYYLDYLGIENNKLYFHQISQAGTVKTNSINILSLFKDMGVMTPDDVEFIDVTNTTRALVYQFRKENKKEKTYEQIFVYMTHHNMRPYVCKGSPILKEDIENDKASFLTFAGSTEEAVYWAQRNRNNTNSGFKILEYTPKAELTADRFYHFPKDENIYSSQTMMYSLSGAYYTERDNDFSAAQAVVKNGKVYLNAFVKVGEEYAFKIYQYNDELEAVEILAEDKSPVGKKDIGKMGILLTKEGYCVQTEFGKNLLFKVEDKTVTKIESASIDPEKVIFNPSLLFINTSESQFVHLINGETYTFDVNQLNKDEVTYFRKK